MTPQAFWTRQAEADIKEIAYWIAVEDNRPLTAHRIVEELRDKADLYANSPDIGQTNPDFPVGWNYFRYKRWIILYQKRDVGIDILRVLDGSRDFPTLF